MASRNEMIEVMEFLRRGSDKSTLSQIIIPFCSDTTGERAPVALLSGNINLRTSLKKDNLPAVLEDELNRLELEISSKKMVKGQVIDLSSEIKRLQLETPPANEAEFKEVEIKEEWTPEDEALILNRRSRTSGKFGALGKAAVIKKAATKKPLMMGDDIDELLRLAELEEEEEEAARGRKSAPSKVEEIKREFKRENLIQAKSSNQFQGISQMNLPKINSLNSLVGDVIERASEPPKKPANEHIDQVSSRIILNELRKLDLKTTVVAHEKDNDDGEDDGEEDDENDYEEGYDTDHEEEKAIVAPQAPLKKSSLFSLRKQQ